MINIIGSHNRSQFNYCIDWNYEKIAAKPKVELKTRVCYITTKAFRVYLVFVSHGFEFHPFEYIHMKWVKVRLDDRVNIPTFEELTQSEERLKELMVELFFRQFPKAEESFYDKLPSVEDVKDKLNLCPTVQEIDKNFYMYNVKELSNMKDANGIVSVNVDEGSLDIPFVKNENEEIKLLVDRCTVRPESKILYLYNRIFDRIDAFIVKLQLISWQSFRRYVETLY